MWGNKSTFLMVTRCIFLEAGTEFCGCHDITSTLSLLTVYTHVWYEWLTDFRH